MRFLVIQTGDIGDLIVSTPALSALREAHPQAHISLLATSHAVPAVMNTGLVDEFIRFDRTQFNSTTAFFKPANLHKVFALRKGGYDAVLYFRHFTLKLGTIKFALVGYASRAKKRIGLQNGNGWFLTDTLPDSGFGAKHEAQYWLDLVALLGAQDKPYPTKVQIGTSPLPKPHGKKRIVIHAGSGGYSLARRWDVEHFAQVADELHWRYDEAQIVLVGGKGDDGIAVEACMTAPAVNLTGQTSLAELAGVIADADLYIGADSGVMHLASACGVPMVALFGPSNHQAWGAWSPNGQVVILRSGTACSPCSYVGHGIGAREGCVARTCMKLITPQHVIEEAKCLLDNASDTPYYEISTENPPAFIPTKWQRQTILGLPVDGLTYLQWLETIGEWVQHGARCHHVCTTNPEFMMIAQKDSIFAGVLRRADICVPDGVGLLWAAKRLGQPLPERVTGSDGVPKIAEEASKRGWKLFFLGAREGVAQQAADVLLAQYPTLQIVGIYAGSPAPEEEASIVSMINQSGADILFVAYGAPKQDLWIARNLPRLRCKMAMGVGGSFDFIAGIVPRAPVWMRNFGLEWLYRLYLQPSRIGRMTRLPRFVWAVLRRGRR